MRQKAKKWSAMVLAVLALVLVMGSHVGESAAYFTTYATAKGGHWIELRASSQIRERMVEWDKFIQVENTGDVTCYVRVKAFAGNVYELTYTDNSNGKWSLAQDGYWYYSEPVAPGAMTDELVISIEIPAEQAGSFNVTVIQESTRALYDKHGAAYADWTLKAEISGAGSIEEGGQADE